MDLLLIQFFIFLVKFMMIYATEPFEKCPLGYHWPACSVPCRSPSYGNDCQSECTSCTKEHCNHVTGCTEINVTHVMAVEDKKHILYHSTSGTSVNNSSEEGKRPQGMPPSCPSILKTYKIKAMVISLCIMASVLFVIIGVYLKLNKTNYFRFQYIQNLREQDANPRTENSIL